jgi:hypothetical protein
MRASCQNRNEALNMPWKDLLLLATLALPASTLCRAQAPEAIGDHLLRLDGTDPVSRIHYTKLISLLESADTPTNAGPESLPRFTLECREQNGKRSLHWLVRFDGNPDFAFQRPLMSTSADPNPTPNPSVLLKMRFEGYMKSEEFKRQWEVLPTGELHYRNPGMGSANLDEARHFMQWLTSLPSIRLSYVRPQQRHDSSQPAELLFALKPLLDFAKKTDFCQP